MFEREFDIFAHEEIGIRKARAEHVFVAFADNVEMQFVTIPDCNEVRQQRCGVRGSTYSSFEHFALSSTARFSTGK
jgi:hypothetical protein